MSIGELIRKLRNNAFYTQHELGIRLGVTQRAVSLWECGKRCPSARAMRGLIVVFGKHEKELREAYAKTN